MTEASEEISNNLPERLTMTALRRAMIDFQVMLSEEKELFSNDKTISDLVTQVKILFRRIYILYLGTFLGACLILAGGLPSNTQVTAFGIEISVDILSQQVLSVLTAGVFSYYASTFVSASMCLAMLALILRKEKHESWEFLIARYDATLLWTNLLRPKTVGYQSPWQERIVRYPIMAMSIIVTILHAFIIWAANFSALEAANETGSWFAITLSLVAIGSVSLTIIAVLAVHLLKLPYCRT